MRKANAKDLSTILSYLRRDIPNCIYMYIDIGKYGLDNPNMEVWLGEGESELNLVAMRYYNSLQLFSLSDVWEVEAVAELINMYDFPVVNGKVALLEKLQTYCRCYELHPGKVFACKGYMKKDLPFSIEHSNSSDYYEIAQLMCSVSTFAHYDVDSLAYQLRERAETGMGRNRVVRVNGQIIAHIATFAEFDNIAVTSGLVVSPDHTDYPYGSIMESELFRELLEEDNLVYTFITDRRRSMFLRSIGCQQVADYGKMVKKDN